MVYDVSSFINEHPGGKKILQRVLGQDASKQFWKYHNEKVMQKYGAPLKIGTIGSSSAQSTTPAPKTKPVQPKYSPPKPKLPTQAAPVVKASPPSDGKSTSEIFGEVETYLAFSDSSSFRSLNLHGIQDSLHLIITNHTIVSESLCVRTWKKI